MFESGVDLGGDSQPRERLERALDHGCFFFGNKGLSRAEKSRFGQWVASKCHQGLFLGLKFWVSSS